MTSPGTINCPECTAAIPAQAKRCMYCGAKIGTANTAFQAVMAIVIVCGGLLVALALWNNAVGK